TLEFMLQIQDCNINCYYTTILKLLKIRLYKPLTLMPLILQPRFLKPVFLHCLNLLQLTTSIMKKFQAGLFLRWTRWPLIQCSLHNEWTRMMKITTRRMSEL
ncbi:unnamed protein product, partial [Vicia faba]